jgi:hypothetical protein
VTPARGSSYDRREFQQPAEAATLMPKTIPQPKFEYAMTISIVLDRAFWVRPKVTAFTTSKIL